MSILCIILLPASKFRCRTGKSKHPQEILSEDCRMLISWACRVHTGVSAVQVPDPAMGHEGKLAGAGWSVFSCHLVRGNHWIWAPSRPLTLLTCAHQTIELYVHSWLEHRSRLAFLNDLHVFVALCESFEKLGGTGPSPPMGGRRLIYPAEFLFQSFKISHREYFFTSRVHI